MVGIVLGVNEFLLKGKDPLEKYPRGESDPAPVVPEADVVEAASSVSTSNSRILRAFCSSDDS